MRRQFTHKRSSVNPKLRLFAIAVAYASAVQGGDGAQERWRTASKRSAVAAAETFRDSTWPQARQGDEAVAGGGHAGAQALALAAEDEDRGAGQVDRPRAAAWPSASAPQIQKPASFAVGQPVGEVADVGDLEVLDRAGRGLAGRRGDRGRAPLGDDHPGRAGELGRAADGAEVARVLDLVERHDQRVGSRAASRRRRRRDRDRPRRRPPGGRASRRAAPAPPPRSPAPARPGAPRRLPRSASCDRLRRRR